MCGICGIYGNKGEPVDYALLKEMTDTIVHRGPDDDGFFVEGGVGLGMRRLSIIDLAGGEQPISNEDGQVVTVYNGEIYNYANLREQLTARGHTFRTDSDTECIVHLYEEFGSDFVCELRGMFAIALFDRSRQRLLLARDRLGKKPLFYAFVGGRLLFGSEIKPLLVAAPELRQVNQRAIQPFFRFGFVPEPETAYKDIFKLPAGSLLECQDGNLSIRRYWDLSFSKPSVDSERRRSAEDYQDELDALLEESVRMRLMSEVPLGAFLSGGLDSSLVVAYMSRLMSKPVKTFTIAYDESAFDESEDAKRVADHCHTEHHVKVLRLDDIKRGFFGTVDEIVHHTGEPFGDSSALPTYHVSKLAREEVTVILAGDGADEVFGGYTIYQGLRFAQAYQHLPGWIRHGIVAPGMERWVKMSEPGPRRWRANAWQKRFADSDLPLPEMLVSKYSKVASSLLDRLVRDDGQSLDERSGLQWMKFGDAIDPFEKIQYSDTRFVQLNDMLVKVDRMSMAHSLEVRSPYLDHKVVEFAATLPPSLKLRRYETKAILRDVAARYLPVQNVRKRKHGFGVPISLWFRDALWQEVSERLMSSSVIREYLNIAVVSEILEEHHSGRSDYSQLIWCLLMFDAWHGIYLKGW